MPITLLKTADMSVDIFNVEFSGVLKKDELPKFKEHVAECLANKNPFVVVFNFTKIQSVKAKLVLLCINHLKKYESFAVGKLIACSIVLDNSLILEIFNMLSLTSAPVVPNIFTKDANDALEFVKDHIELYKINKRKKSTTKNF